MISPETPALRAVATTGFVEASTKRPAAVTARGIPTVTVPPSFTDASPLFCTRATFHVSTSSITTPASAGELMRERMTPPVPYITATPRVRSTFATSDVMRPGMLAIEGKARE